MHALPWVAIFLAAALAIARVPRAITLGLLAIGYASAFALGQLEATALIPIALLVGTGLLLRRAPSPAIGLVCNLVFVAVAIALFQHKLPGFHNLEAIHAERFTPDAAPFTMYLNFDKPLISFWLVLACPWIEPHENWRRRAAAALVACAATSFVCLAIAFVAGSIAWAPKWPPLAWLWVLNNLLLVAFAEEAFFRGYVQGGIGRLAGGRSSAQWIGLAVGALLFGALHFQGGALLVVVASIAGLGAGLAYRAGGLQAAVLTHFGLNLIHFGLFTYPFIART